MTKVLFIALSLLLVGCGKDFVLHYSCESILPVPYYNCYLDDDVGNHSFTTCVPSEQDSVGVCVGAGVSAHYPQCSLPVTINDTIPTSGEFTCEKKK